MGWLCIVCHASQAEQSAITNTLRDQIQLCLNVQLLQRVVWFPVCVNCRELVEHWDMFASQARQNLAPYCKPFSDGNSQNVEAAMIKEDQILKVSLWTHESRQAATNSIQLESTGSRKSPVTAHKVQQSAQSKLPHLNAHPPPMLSKKPIQVTRVQIQRIVQMPPQQINVQQHPQPMGDDEPPLQVQQPEIADICSMPQKFQALQPQVEEPQEDPAENTQVHAWEMVDIKDEPLPEIGDLETEPIESVLVSQVAAEPEVEESVSAHLDPLMISPSSSADHRQRQLTKRQAVGLKWKKALRKKRVTQPKLQHKSVEIVTVASHPSSSSNQPPTAAPTPSETGLKFVQLSQLTFSSSDGSSNSELSSDFLSTTLPDDTNTAWLGTLQNSDREDSIPEIPSSSEENTKTVKRRDTSRWEQKKQHGEAYVDHRGRAHPAKKIGGGCLGTCKLKCMETFSEEERNIIHKGFWKLTDPEKTLFYMQYVEKVNKKKTSNPNAIIIRQRFFTYKYFMACKGVRTKVCKKFFLRTLNVHPHRIYTCFNSMVNHVSMVT